MLAAVNTGNNLLFMILACTLAGILISGVLSRVVLTGVDLKFDMPEHIFAEQPVLAELELRNEKQTWPSFSLLVVGETKKSTTQVLTRPVYFPYIPRQSAARQKVELTFPKRGVYRQDALESAPDSRSASSRKLALSPRTSKSQSTRACSPRTSSTKCSRC